MATHDPLMERNQELTDARNKNLDERGAKEAQDHLEKMKNHVPFKAYQKPDQEAIDQEVKHKTKNRS